MWYGVTSRRFHRKMRDGSGAPGSGGRQGFGADPLAALFQLDNRRAGAAIRHLANRNGRASHAVRRRPADALSREVAHAGRVRDAQSQCQHSIDRRRNRVRVGGRLQSCVQENDGRSALSVAAGNALTVTCGQAKRKRFPLILSGKLDDRSSTASSTHSDGRLAAGGAGEGEFGTGLARVGGLEDFASGAGARVVGRGFAWAGAAGAVGQGLGPCISSRWGLWTREAELAPPVDCPSPRPSKSELRSSRPREERGEGEEGPPPRKDEPPRFFEALAGRLAA